MFTNRIRPLSENSQNSQVSLKDSESEGSQLVMDAMADAGLRVVISAPEARGRVPGTRL